MIDEKGRRLKTKRVKSTGTEAIQWGGETRSSEEGSVMLLERRGFVIQPEGQNQPVTREEF